MAAFFKNSAISGHGLCLILQVTFIEVKCVEQQFHLQPPSSHVSSNPQTIPLMKYKVHNT